MNIAVMGGARRTAGGNIYLKMGYTYAVWQNQLVVNAGAAVNIFTPLGGGGAPTPLRLGYMVILQNLSVGGQNIRYGDAGVNFGAGPTGILLPPALVGGVNQNPLARQVLLDWAGVLWAVASVNGALLDLAIWRTDFI